MSIKRFLDLEGLQLYDQKIKDYIDDQIPIYYNTTANWNAQSSLVSEKGALYVYSDYQTLDGQNIPGVKVGDGQAYVIDLPFLTKVYDEYIDVINAHINNSNIHVTAQEKASWNNKITCYVDPEDSSHLVLTND